METICRNIETTFIVVILHRGADDFTSSEHVLLVIKGNMKCSLCGMFHFHQWEGVSQMDMKRNKLPDATAGHKYEMI